MKILYLDCGMGAAGDMLTAALLELLPNPAEFLKELNGLGLPHTRVKAERTQRCGITGTQVHVQIRGNEEGETQPHEHEPEHAHGHTYHHEHEHEHHHHSLCDIETIVRELPVSPTVQEDVLAVYRLIAEAESHAHNRPVTEVHFHEVGALDAVADVTAVCLLMEQLAPDQVIASPVHVGSGQVRCAHGILPVPAPATAHILRGVPIYGGAVKGELCTPTGAALLKHFVDHFGEMPPLEVEQIGYGMGKKEFEAANCVRAMLGKTGTDMDTVVELSCNVDDMTAEELGCAMERLLEAGVNEVFTVPVGMKKSRPGILLKVVCRPEQREDIVRLLFRTTSTIGIRESLTRRYVLEREVENLDTPWGPVRRKRSRGYGVERVKYEYEDLRRIARELNIRVSEAARRVEKALEG